MEQAPGFLFFFSVPKGASTLENTARLHCRRMMGRSGKVFAKNKTGLVDRLATLSSDNYGQIYVHKTGVLCCCGNIVCDAENCSSLFFERKSF